MSEVDMDGFILGYFLIKLIRVFDRAVFYTGSTTRAFALVNIFGLFSQRYLEVSFFPCYTVNYSIGQDLNIGLPVDLDQFGVEYSHGAVIGGKGLVKLGHMAPNARPFFNQVNLISCSCKIKRGLNTANPSTNNHYVSKVTVFVHFLSPLSSTFSGFPCPYCPVSAGSAHLIC